ncbi:MAG: LPS assembly protein LptD, partial [Gammaproteobacteria bacterium]
GDRFADADQASAAITSRYLDSNGRELARVSLGQIHYFADRRVSLSNPLQAWIPRYSPVSDTSALAAEFAFSLGRNWQLSSDGQWNEDSGEIDEGNFRLRYQADSDHILNLNYRYRQLVNSPLFILPPGIDPRIKQTDLSGVWPLGQRWKLLARWNYDHANGRNLESFAGVEYSNCCTTIRLVAREWVDENELFVPGVEPQRGIFVQFTLHGLGNLTGGGLSNLLQDGIRGFRDTSDNYPVY